MIQKETLLVPADKSGIWLTKTIHTYSKLSKILRLNNFGKISIQQTNSRVNILRKKKKKFLFVRSKKNILRKCGNVLIAYNSNLLLKKRLTPVGKRVIGFVFKEIKRKKAISSFVKIL